MSDDLYYEPKNDFFLRTKQSIDRQFVTLEIRVAKALFEDTPDTSRADGMFHRGNIQLIVPGQFADMEPEEVLDWVVLEPESLPMQLLRLAYLAAHHQEGPYGADDL